MSKISSMVKNLLESDSMGIATMKPTYVQSNTQTDIVAPPQEDKAKQVAFCVYLNGKEIEKVFYPEGTSVEEIKKSLIEKDGFDPAIVVKVEGEKIEDDCQKDTVNEFDNIKLSPKQYKTLFTHHIAESMLKEELEKDEELEKYGLIKEGKMTDSGKDWIKKWLPTVFSS